MIDERALEAAARALCAADGCHEDDIDDLWHHYTGNTRAALQAYLGALDGHVLVPVEPTEAMLLDAVDAWHESEFGLDQECRSVYLAMLAAARPQIEWE